jgi:ATP-binding cassette subfamily F protein 3
MLAKMEELAPIHAAAAFSFEFREPERAPNPLLVMENVSAGYLPSPLTGEGQGERVEVKTILANLTLTLQAGQRVGLLGVNGAGKSTLVKTLVGELPPLSGEVRHGKGLAIGYFAQHQLDMLRHDQSPLWHLTRLAPSEKEQELRNFLGSFNFPGDMATVPIAPFSGGEKARLALALIVWQRPNLLLLDEPTNHLDLDTREALTVALAQFEGTLVLVSHDRHLLRATTDEFMIVADGGLRPFEGDLDDYRDWLFRTRLAKPAGAETAPLPRADRKAERRQEAEARQKLAAARKPIEHSIARLEQQLDGLNRRKASVEARLAGADIYAETNREELKRLLLEQAEVARELDTAESEWLAQQEKLEALGPA